MGIVDDYINETNKYKLSHGDKTVVLMQCGSFFEIYGLKDKNGNYVIEPLPISIDDPNTAGTMKNPLVVQDEAEREAAQEVINKTPQAVIDSINT